MTTELYEIILYCTLYLFIFLFGIVIGSFLNVCILRIPEEQSIAKDRSHCMHCGYWLKWYDLIPIFSYLFLGGKCRKCKTHISLQYPLIEGLNAILYMVIFAVNGWNIDSVFYCLLTSALIVLSVIDFRTYIIPQGINLFILALGLIHLIFDLENWLSYVIGFLLVSGILLLVVWFSKGRGMGGGDVKLMAAAGALIGWEKSYIALIIGCILGSVIHITRMIVSKKDHRLAFGPYLAAGIFIAVLCGDAILNWYLACFKI